MKKILEFILSAMALKKVDRAGWNKDRLRGGKRYICKVKKPESVPCHTWSSSLLLVLRLFQLGYRGIAFETMAMMIIHDLPESVSGDKMTHFLSQSEIDDNDQQDLLIFKTMTDDLPDELKNWLNNLMADFIEGKTFSARLVKDCELADPILQGVSYQKDPENIVDPTEFLETNIPKITDPKLVRALESILKPK